MGYGLGHAMRAAGEGRREYVEDERRHEREDFALDQAGKQAERTDTLFQQQQEDRNFGLPLKRKAAQRDDELGDFAQEIKRNEMDIWRLVKGAQTEAAQHEVFQKIQELEMKNYGLVYSAYKTRGGPAAAQLLNDMKGNGINTAADLIVDTDESGKQVLKVVDANGNVVKDKKGEAVFPLEALEKMFGPKQEWTESERGRTEKHSGKFIPHGKDVPGSKSDKDATELAKFQRLLTNDAVAILQSRFGGRFEGGVWFPDEENRDAALDAMVIAADLIKNGENPQRAANIAAKEATRAIGAPSKRGPAIGATPSMSLMNPSGWVNRAHKNLLALGEYRSRLDADPAGFDASGHEFQPGTEGGAWISLQPSRQGNESQSPKQQPPRPKGMTSKAILASAVQRWQKTNRSEDVRRQIRERLEVWGIPEAEIAAAGL